MTKITQLPLIILFLAVGLMSTLKWVEAKEGKAMENLRILIDGKVVTLTPPPLLKDGVWLVPLEAFTKHIGAKVEYPQGSEIAVICQADRCVPLELGDSSRGAMLIDGRLYASPKVIAEPFGFQIQVKSPHHIEIVKGDSGMKGTGNAIGRLAQDFTLLDLDGTPRRLSDFRGKKTLLYIWGSW